MRTTYARFDDQSGKSEWRILEEGETYGELQNPHGLLGATAAILVSVFRSLAVKEEESAVKVQCQQGTSAVISMAPDSG